MADELGTSTPWETFLKYGGLLLLAIVGTCFVRCGQGLGLILLEKFGRTRTNCIVKYQLVVRVDQFVHAPSVVAESESRSKHVYCCLIREEQLQ